MGKLTKKMNLYKVLKEERTKTMTQQLHCGTFRYKIVTGYRKKKTKQIIKHPLKI